MTVVGLRPAMLAIAQTPNEGGRRSGSSDADPTAAAATRSAVCRWRSGEAALGGDAVYAAVDDDENPYPITDVDAEEPLF